MANATFEHNVNKLTIPSVAQLVTDNQGNDSHPLKSTTTTWTLISSLGRNQPTLTHPVMCEVKPIDSDHDNYIATFPNANLVASGCTRREAIENLRDIIASKYRIFSSHEATKLGAIPRQQLTALRQFIQD